MINNIILILIELSNTIINLTEKLMNIFERDNEKLFEITKRINAFIGAFLVYTLSDLVYLMKEFFQKSKDNFLEVPSLK